MRRGWSGLLILVLVAGCAQPPAAVPGPTESPSPSTGGGSNGNQSAPRTLNAAPEWVLGEWWEYEAIEHFTGLLLKTRRVMAGVENNNFLAGMPVERWSNAYMLFHLPGFGEVNRTTLAFETHDVPFEPLNFPLTAGKTWITHFEGVTYRATVKSLEGQKAFLALQGASDGNDATPDGSASHWMNATYDADIGEIVSYDDPTYMTYRITAHGFDHQGRVSVPHEHDLVFQNFRFANLKYADERDIPPPPMEETVTIGTTYDRVSFVILVGTPVTEEPVPGQTVAVPQTYYKERVTAPNGAVYELTAEPDDPGGTFQVAFLEHAKPAGTWKIEHTTAGPGLAGTEGIGYHVYEIDLPSGHVLPSTGNHDHGS